MSILSQQAFNLLLNSTFSFFAGVLIVLSCLWIFRVDNSRWKLFFLSLPFIKILWDLGFRKIPTTSIVNSGINPLDLPPKHQNLIVGAGFSQYGPELNVVFSANALDGKSYSTSVPDYVYAWMTKNLGHEVPTFILITILSVAVCLMVQRLGNAIRFEMRRIKNKEEDSFMERISLRYRTIEVYSSENYQGTPFTGGIFHPYICFPKNILNLLDSNERAAVLKHEVAHVVHWDLLVTLLIKSLGDILWFIPGYRFLSRKIDSLREILADKTAVRSGASAPHLASALIKLREIPEDNHQPILYSAFFREKSLLKVRVEHLLGEKNKNKNSRFGWRKSWVKLLVTVWTTGAVLVATFGGNYEYHVEPIPVWVQGILKNLGFL